MGKKKSMVLMILLTIVIVVLCAITVFPSFAIPGTVKEWNPAVKQYDLGADLGGGYYAYYYPEGIISEAEYNNNLSVLTGDKADEYKSSYVKHGGLYLSTDEDYGIIGEDGKSVLQEFKDDFKAVTSEIVSRYEQKGYSEYRVSVVDDYALRVQLPASETTAQQSSLQSVSNTLSIFSQTGAISIEKGEAMIDELKEMEVTDLIKSFEVKTKYEVAYISINFTSAGKAMIEKFVEDSKTATDSSSSQTTTLNIMVGDDAAMKIDPTQHITTKYEVRYPVADQSEISYVETFVILLNSALKNGAFDIQFRSLASSDLRTYGAVDSDNTLLYLYIMLAAVIVAITVFMVVKMGRYGAVSIYTNLSYLIVVGLCFAFISSGVFEVSLGSVLVFLAGFALMNVIHAHVYNAIKAEFELGKTVESSVKGGFKKTLFGIVDIYAVLLLGSLALLFGGAGLFTVALQAIICVVTGAFCSLLWGRVINYMFLSASKNKYKYFRFVREDDDDE